MGVREGPGYRLTRKDFCPQEKNKLSGRVPALPDFSQFQSSINGRFADFFHNGWTVSCGKAEFPQAFLKFSQNFLVVFFSCFPIFCYLKNA